jgi:two-component system, cell cycle sensor histidine kinase and response regulator CckA
MDRSERLPSREDLLDRLRHLEAENLALSAQVKALASSSGTRIGQRSDEFRAAQEALCHSEERCRYLVECAGDAIFTIGATGEVVTVNAQACRSLGYARHELVGLHVTDIQVGIPTETLHRIQRDVVNRPLGADALSVNGIHRRKDGTTFPVEARISALPAEDGAGATLLVLARDVSERQRLESQLLQAQKMESVGRLAGGIAHDFNNLLTTIVGYAELLRMEQPQLGDCDELKQILEASHRATELTQQLLAFSRRQRLELRTLDLGEVVNEAVRMLGRLLGDDIRIDLHLTNSPTFVRANAVQVQQVLLNLAVNSRDAMPSGGRLVVELAERDIDEATAALCDDLVAGRYILLTVADDGDGMAPEVQSHLFEPFFTTKPRGKGTGLGLATVYGIVKQHSGQITIHSEIGKGTTVQILLPATDERTSGPTIVRTEQQPLRGTDRLLVVDDSPGIRRFLRDGLTRLGYRVNLAADGAEALQWLQTYGRHVDLVLSDVVMPVLGGIELMSHMAKSFPALPAVLMSGYLEDHPDLNETLARGTRLLRKPLSLVEVTHTIRAAIDGAKAGSQ